MTLFARTVMNIVAIGITICLFALPSAHAKNLEKRLGFGFNQELAQQPPYTSLSVKYWFSPRFGLQGLLGFVIGKEGDKNTAGLNLGQKVLYNIIDEENMNVHFAGTFGLEVYKKDVDKKAVGVMVGAGCGVEYFFNRLPNLSFGAEIGLAFKTSGGNTSFGTYGAGLALGIHYYLGKPAPSPEEPL